jgi:hypothetical protein
MTNEPNTHYSFNAEIKAIDIPRILREAPGDVRIVVIKIGSESIIATRSAARKLALDSGAKLVGTTGVTLRSEYFPCICGDASIRAHCGSIVPQGTDWYFCVRGKNVSNEDTTEEVLKSYMDWFAASDKYYANTKRVAVSTY